MSNTTKSCNGTYQPPPLLGNAHLQTVIPTLFRRVTDIRYQRQRLELPDGDFLDLDWSETGRARLALLCHGLESSAQAPYMKGMARACNRAGWDVVAINLRGCSGVPNRLLRSYHSGASEDLAAVLGHCQKIRNDQQIALIGFSLGGNLVLKYAGETGRALPGRISHAVAISVPCDLEASALSLAKPANRFYEWRFVSGLKQRTKEKCQTFGEVLRWEDFRDLTSLRQFDDRYTAPVHGFRDARDYWQRCSAAPLIPEIAVPTLLLSAADDPFLAGDCYPLAAAASNPLVRLKIPSRGGHVGFFSLPLSGDFWHERMVVDFLAK